MFDLAIVSFVGFWLALFPFALIGLFNLGYHRREHVLLGLILLANAATSILYFTGTRFRTPIDGFAMIWAAIGVNVLVEKWHRRKSSQPILTGQAK